MSNKKLPLLPDIAQYNDAIADMYDTATAAEDWSVNHRLQQALEAHPQNIQKVLDLGAGTGQTVDVIHQVASSPCIIAVDASSKMLKLLRQKYPTPTIKVVHATIEDYVAGCKETFDLITAMGSLEFVQNLPQLLKQCIRLLNPGGRLIITYVPSSARAETQRTFEAASVGQAFTEYYWSPESINNILVSQGLTIESQNSFSAYTRGTETVTYAFVVARHSPA